LSQRISMEEGTLVEGARTVGTEAGRVRDRIVASAKEKLESSREYVAENPMKSILVAVGVGAVIGYLIGRRSSGS
jgi:ElaB/YqjD/DUF883 family membrane-anchored ribosome-binding protein